MSWLQSAYSFYERRRKQCDDLPTIDGMLAAHFAIKLPEIIDAQTRLLFFDLIAVLSASARQGHSCLEIEKIANTCWFQSAECQGITLPQESEMMAVLQSCMPHVPSACLVLERKRLYMQRYRQFEVDIAECIRHRLAQSKASAALSQRQCDKLRALWPKIFVNQTLEMPPLDEHRDAQERAVYQSLIQSTLVINGGPGTGKTYTAARVVCALGAIFGEDAPLHIKLIAPTGKAAQRLSESFVEASQSLPMDGVAIDNASTIHRFLGLRKGRVQTSGLFADKQTNTNCDVLIVDEASMLDTALFARLCRAVSPHTRLVLLGDADQLPSVEAGNVLADLIAGIGQSEFKKSMVTLTQSRRFSGALRTCAKACLDSNVKEFLDVLKATTEFQWHDDNPSFSVLKKLALDDFSALRNANSLQQAFHAIKQRRWLTPFRQSEYGVEPLNALIENWVFARKNTKEGGSFFKGQVIMVMENHTLSDLYNGDVGLIWPDETGRLSAYFEVGKEQYRAVALSRLPKIESAFAMTIHKSQGSEFAFPRLILADVENTSEQAWRIVNRSLIYTAITRAREGLGVVATEVSIKQALSTCETRMSGLVGRLSQALLT
jgi:exodeoxyribonuclease V alpha subunit